MARAILKAAQKTRCEKYKIKTSVTPTPAIILDPLRGFIEIKDNRGTQRRIYVGTARIKRTRYKGHDGGEMCGLSRWGNPDRSSPALAKARDKRAQRTMRNMSQQGSC